MSRPSKKDIKNSIDKLKEKSAGGSDKPRELPSALPEKKSSIRIRKQGI